jgi:hypothetical protein
MLACLLLLCLMAPRNWRGNKANDDAMPGVGTQPRGSNGAFCMKGWDEYRRSIVARGSQAGEMEISRLWAPPTLEELIAARAATHQFVVSSDWSAGPTWPTPLEFEQPQPPAEPATPGPRVTMLFEQIGRFIAEYSLADTAPRLSSTMAYVYELWSAPRDDGNRPELAGPPATEDAGVPASPSTVRVLNNASRGLTTEASRAQSPDGDSWCMPQTLLEQLRRLAEHPLAADWAERTIAQLVALTDGNARDAANAGPLLESLSESAQEAFRMAELTEDDRLRVELLRAHWGLARRIDCWTALHEIRLAERSRERLALHGSLESFFTGVNNHREASPRAVLSTQLEAYERSRDPQLGRNVVHRQRELESSPDGLDHSLADSVERHYRNANIRIALTGELLNRLAGDRHSEVRALRDRIAGAPVSGQSHTASESRVRLNPVEGGWHLTVEAQGTVDSNTLADGGNARLRSRSATGFTASKSVIVDAEGVHLERTAVNATSHNRLVGVTTDYDWVPLVGSFARDRAMAQYRSRRGRAQAETELRVSNEAVARVDRETLEAVERIERQVRERFTNRLAEAGIGVTPIEMTTRPERVVARLRVAGDHQLGSHTPRPRALSDSLASLQVHETALTNAAVTLSLDAGRYSGRELQALFREKFPGMASQDADVRRDAVFQFAEQDALVFHIDDGRLELSLKVASVALDGRTMRNFVVHAFYVPVVNGLEAELVRDGSLGIEGRLSSADRARLHNVFNAVLPADRRLPIVRLDELGGERLEGLMITQLVLEDGWLGLAIGPAFEERMAERSRSLR